MTASTGSSVPDAAVLAAVLRSRCRWCWKQRLIACFVSKHKNRPAEVRGKSRNFHRNRGFAVEEMDHLDPSTFKRMFQVDRSTFDELLDLITPHLIQCSEVTKNSSGSFICTKTRLAVTLRWLAGGSHLDLCFAWGVAHSTFFSERGVLWPVIEALDDAFALGFPVNDLNRLAELSKGFYEHSGGFSDDCVLAVDSFGV
jgi:hypothetical protein